MSKPIAAILYIAVVLSLFAPTVERVRTVIIPGMQKVSSALQEAGR